MDDSSSSDGCKYLKDPQIKWKALLLSEFKVASERQNFSSGRSNFGELNFDKFSHFLSALDYAGVDIFNLIEIEQILFFRF